VVSSTILKEQIFIRVAIIGHRSIQDDFDTFVRHLLHTYQIRLKM
jgi:hypothetical protein